MRIRRPMVAVLTLGVTLVGLMSCRTTPPSNDPQAIYIPTARNQWRVFCNESMPSGGLYSYVYNGSYQGALNSGLCDARGGVKYAWDMGLTVFGLTPHVSILVPEVFEPGGTPGTGGPLQPDWRNASCNVATCQDSARNLYRVTYLDRRGEGRDRLSCPGIGLLNNPQGTRDVAATRIDGAPAVCQIGIAGRRGRGAR